ncbi:hypothetical protein FQN57_001171 [Myotisia sp. PD_48]|nr:hypothetical protein FQN57_001171 [Myotisia sp. PD_48]
MNAASISLLDNPLLKVSRPIAACSRCRASKVKCDGKLPACSACERAGNAQSCLGANNEFARGKERSYVAALEALYDRLKDRLANLQQSPALSVATANGTPNILSPGPNDAGNLQYRKEASDIDDLVGDFGFLSVNATSRDFYGITSSTSFAGLLLTISMTHPLPSFDFAIDYPDRADTIHSVKRYFGTIYVLMPFLSETRIWASVNAIYQDRNITATSFDHWILRMVLAISLAMEADFQHNEEYNKSLLHVHAALRYAEDVLQPGSLAGIQAILLLMQFSLFSPRYFATWYLVGMAARVATDLGIHQEQRSALNMDEEVLDQRRRTFHCLYSLDRYVSSALGRPFSFSDDSVNVPLPSTPLSATDMEDFKLPVSMFPKSIKPVTQLFEIRRYQSAIYQNLFFSGQSSLDPEGYFWCHCSTITKWFNSVQKDTPSHLIPIYRLELLYTFILLLSPSKRAPVMNRVTSIRLFGNTTEFIARFQETITSPDISPLVTYIDFERAYTVACLLLNLVTHHHNQVLDNNTPSDHEQATSPSQSAHISPPLSNPIDPAIPAKRALKCLQTTVAVLDHAKRRWGVVHLLDDFKLRASPVTSFLARRYSVPQQNNDTSMPYNTTFLDTVFSFPQSRPYPTTEL